MHLKSVSRLPCGIIVGSIVAGEVPIRNCVVVHTVPVLLSLVAYLMFHMFLFLDLRFQLTILAGFFSYSQGVLFLFSSFLLFSLISSDNINN